MNQCPIHHGPALRPGLPPLTKRLESLPRDERGYPVPYFVAWIEGKPDFRIADPQKIVACVKSKLCWTCGQGLGRYQTFAVGPMCVVNRTSSEPPSHLECVLWSVKGCPFLSRPNMVRREDEMTEAMESNVAGIMIDRNPGVTCAWTTLRYTIWLDPLGKPLFNIGEPDSVSWWREGRPATRAEVQASIDSGLPKLEEVAKAQSEEACRALVRQVDLAMEYLPK